jgi:hypothetical protein
MYSVSRFAGTYSNPSIDTSNLTMNGDPWNGSVDMVIDPQGTNPTTSGWGGIVRITAGDPGADNGGGAGVGGQIVIGTSNNYLAFYDATPQPQYALDTSASASDIVTFLQAIGLVKPS